MTSTAQDDHIGQHVRDHVIPSGMTVTQAAKRLGVGRQALSSLLNGRASLSEQMALRLERAFGASGDELLERQRSRKRVEGTGHERAPTVRGCIPDFLTIKARDIEQWAVGNIEARELLSVLLRKLIHETGRNLTRVDFPGYDNSQRAGWDGVVEAGTGTAWIPAGLSVWEFGAGARPPRKADGDYADRLPTPLNERARRAFAFVTPRNWAGKDRWAEGKGASGDGWKAVRAYDASDLEQWLEDAVATQLWFSERCLGRGIEGIRTLDRHWHDWSEASDPPLSPRIFEPNIKTSLCTFKRWLSGPPDRPLVVASDSIGETLAFVTCLFRAAQDSEADADALKWHAKRDMAVVFESGETLRRLAESRQPFIPIAGNVDVEQALAPYWNRRHCVVHAPRNAVSTQPDIVLELLGIEDFHEALDDMGVPKGDQPRLERESGRSRTILRRRLSKLPAVRAPAWSADAECARRLIPMALVGAWRADREADKEILAVLARCPYDELEQAIADFVALDDAPLWSIGGHRGVASKVDALYAVAPRMTAREVHDFFELAEIVLSEPDPALGLPLEHRSAAVIYDKVRDHSDALREGIRETLVLFAIHGDNLFRQRLDIRVATRVGTLIGRILECPDADTLECQERDLPAYAEAAPDAVLRHLEGDLSKDEPAVLALLRPTHNLPFTHSPRIGLLRALECIAWNPAHLGWVCDVLARLARVPIQDNLTDKPIESLNGILRSWMPQTAAPIEDRIRVLATLVRRFPDVMWELCIDELAPGPRHATANYRPKWRGDAAGAGGMVGGTEFAAFRGEVWRLLVSWDHDPSTLGDLLDRLEGLHADDQSTVWGLVDTWAEADRRDEDRAALRERIRRCSLTHGGRRRLTHAAVQRASEAMDKLCPADPVIGHAWLFENGWVDAFVDEGTNDRMDWRAQEARIDALRLAAMGEIWSVRGLDGALVLVDDGNAAEVVGRYAGACADGAEAKMDVLGVCVADTGRDEVKLDAFIRGFVGCAADPAESDLLLRLGRKLDHGYAERLFRCAPFHDHTWRMLDKLPAEVRGGYWRHVTPYGWTFSADECREVIDRLLEVKRPRAAFAAMKLQWEIIDPLQLIRLLTDVSSVFDEPAGQYPVDPYDLSNALAALSAARAVTVEQLGLLEFAFIDLLEHTEHGMPNLERAVGHSPSLFVQAVGACYPRDDGTEDPAERVGDVAQGGAAHASHKLLGSIRRIPGTRDDGTVSDTQLVRWVQQARGMFAETGRQGIGDSRIGSLLSRASGEDSEWPCTAVCGAMEAVRSDALAEGFSAGTRKARGVVVGDPAQRDRELVDTFRRCSERRRADFPFVSSVLRRLAAHYDSSAELWDQTMAVDKRLGRW